MYKESRKKQGTIIIIALIALLAVIAFIIYPTVNNIIAINHQINSERVNLEYKLSMGLNITKTKKELEKINESNIDIDSVLIKPGEEIAFVQLLETLALQNNIVFSIKSDFIGVESNKLYSKVPIKLILTGSYKNIIKYMSNIESLPNYFNIELLTAISTSEPENIKVQIDGFIYIKLTKSSNE